jgi:dTDP-4-amino-4,6-dideoxygalactose transaminase
MKPYQVVVDFESTVADYAGCKYGVAVDSCTNAIFLCAKYLNVQSTILPSRTYPSVPCSIIHAGGNVSFQDFEWREQGYYRIEPYPIYDAAHLFKKNMYNLVNQPLCGGDINDHAFVCVSFSATKPINIGKGGMILTNDEEATKWFKQARYCGRHEVPLMSDEFEMIGWNMYMTPEQAARGLLLMSDRGGLGAKSMPIPEYPDLSKFKIYKT